MKHNTEKKIREQGWNCHQPYRFIRNKVRRYWLMEEAEINAPYFGDELEQGERIRFESCSKIAYRKKEAQRKCNWLKSIGRERFLKIYHCPDCNFWHLTRGKKSSGNWLRK